MYTITIYMYKICIKLQRGFLDVGVKLGSETLKLYVQNCAPTVFYICRGRAKKMIERKDLGLQGYVRR